MLLECCCGRENCRNLTQFISTSRAMEEELRLAAEIGQALLQKHELYQKETQEFQSALEQQCSRAEKETQELQELVRELQQDQRSWNREREDVQREKGEILDLVRELQQTQSSLELERDDAQRQRNLVENKNESLATALEASYVRARELTKELDNRENEIKRLMANNIKSEKSEEREEDLRRQMEDLKQELTVARKAESAAEARVRKLKTKYDTLHNSHEKLKREQNDNHRSRKLEAVAMLRESNERLKDEFKSSSNNEANAHLITLIKELSSANNKLKSEILEYRQLYTESSNEITSLQARIEEFETASATGYSPYPANYTNSASFPSSFNRGPVQVVDEIGSGDDSPNTAFLEENTDVVSGLSRTTPRPIITRMPSNGISSSYGGPASANTFNSMGVDASVASPVGSLVSTSMLSSSNPLHYHHHYHHYHHYPPENVDMRGNTVFGELEKYIMKKTKPRRPGKGALKKAKKRFAEIGEEDETENAQDDSQPAKDITNKITKPDGSDSESEDLMYSDGSDHEGVTGEEGEGQISSQKNSTTKPKDEKAKVNRNTKDVKDMADSKKKPRFIPQQKRNSVSLLSAGLMNAANNSKIGRDDDKTSTKKNEGLNGTKGTGDIQAIPNRRNSTGTTSVPHSKRGSIKPFGSLSKQHKPNQPSPLALRRRGAPSSLSVKATQSSGLPAAPQAKTLSTKPSIPAFKNPKFATLGPKERKSMMEAWRAGVAKEQEQKNSRYRNQNGEEKNNEAHANLTNTSNVDTVKGKNRMNLSSSPVKDFVEEVLLDEANLSAAEAAALANEVENGLSSRSRRTSTTTVQVTSLMLPVEGDGKSGDNPPSPQHQNPYQALFNQGNHLMDRLKGTNILALNRRLKRQFDMLELSNLSNNLIENILVDVENLRERFRWVEDLRGNEGEKSRGKETRSDCGSEAGYNRDLYSFSTAEFLPLVHLMQDTLAEVGKLRIMLNEVGVSYVQKVEDSQRKAKEEFDRSIMDLDDVAYRKERAQSQNSEGGISAYLKNVFLGSKEVHSPPAASRHYSRRMSVDYTHDRDVSIGSIDTFAEESYFEDRNMDGFSAHNILRPKERRVSTNSVGSLFKGLSFFGSGGGGNNNTNSSLGSTFYDTRDEQVEKANTVDRKNGKKNLEENLTFISRNNHDSLRKQQRFVEFPQNSAANGRGNNEPSTIRSSTNTIRYIGASPTSPPVLSSSPPPPKMNNRPRQIRTAASKNNLESRLRKHLSSTSNENSTNAIYHGEGDLPGDDEGSTKDWNVGGLLKFFGK